MFNFFKKKDKKDKNPDNKYLTLNVREVIRETKDTITIVFDLPEKGIEYLPGQFFTLMPEIDGKEVRRAYSVCTSPDVDQYPAVTVKRVDGGLVSNWLNDNLKEGDTLKVMEPMGNFTTSITSGNDRHVVLFGGGSGITPLMSIAKSVLNGEYQSHVSLVYANRDNESIIFKSALDELMRKYDDRFRVIHVLETADAGWGGPTGWLNTALIKNLLGELPEKDDTSYFICGPEGMMEVVGNSLEELGIEHGRVHKESFTSTVSAEDKAKAAEGSTAHKVTVVYEGEEYEFEVQPDKTILETALDQDIDLPFSCQSGLCTACRGKCVSGSVRMDESDGLSEEELEEGYVLTCVGHPTSEDVKIEIG